MRAGPGNLSRIVAGSMIIATCCFILAGQSGAREFTNKQGKTIEAKIVSATGKQVVLQRSDDKNFTIQVDTLSKEDQAHIAEWKKEHPNYNFRYRFDKKRLKRTGSSKNSREEWAYEMSVHNQGLEDVSGLEIKYTLYRTLRDRYSRGKKNTVSKDVEGNAKIASIKRGNSGTAMTKAITITKHNSVTSNRTGSNEITNTYKKWQESLSGISIAVYKDGKLIDSTDFGSTTSDAVKRRPASGTSRAIVPR